MSTTIFTQTEEVLSQSNKYKSSDGKLLRNAVLEAAEKMDTELLSILLNNDTTKENYFKEVNGIQVFDKQKFAWIIQNKQFLPDSYTRYKNKIGLTNSRGEFISASNDVELVFPYKDCILEGGQTKEDQKNNEIFYNETLAPDQVSNLLAPKAFCNAKKYDKDGVHEVTQITDEDNLIIKGNNLLVLSSLLERYRGKVKCCYIDPPYNTGSDSFGYNDRFNHSTWLTFMKNRLELVKDLLSDDGCIFVQCDDNEQAYLKVLMDEILTFKECIAIKTSTASGVNAVNVKRGEQMFKLKEYLLFYAKNENFRFYPLLTKADSYNKNYKYEVIKNNNEYLISDLSKKYDEKEMINYCLSNSANIYSLEKNNKKAGDKIKIKINESKNCNKVIEFLNSKNEMQLIYDGGVFVPLKNRILIEEGMSYFGFLVSDFWDDSIFQTSSSEGGVELRGGKKPEKLIKRILELSTKENDIVLDYHLGSGTTAAVAHKMGRRYIGIEQLDYGENDSVVRLQKVIAGDQTGISKSQNWQGGGSFIYCELAKLNQNFVDKIQSCKNDDDIKSVTEEILKSDFVSSRVKPSDINTSAKEYSDLTFEEKQQLAIALLDKNQLYVNNSERKDPNMHLSENDIKFTESFYNNLH